MTKESVFFAWKVGDVFWVDKDGEVEVYTDNESDAESYISANTAVKEGYAEYIEDREGIGDMGGGMESQVLVWISIVTQIAP